MSDWIRVQIESPCNAPTQAGINENLTYLRQCIMDCIKRHESPYASVQMLASHPDMLNDLDPALRITGMTAGFAYIEVTSKTVVYTDRGVSSGMKQGIEIAEKMGHPIEYRQLNGNL